jgi:hemerythrin-like domain-containing protein
VTTISGPYADTREMNMVHTAFRREFGLLPAIIRSIKESDTQRAALIAVHVDTLTALLSHHHSGEDKHLWPKLLARGNDDVASTVHLMEAQHECLEDVIEEMRNGVEEWQHNRDDLSYEALTKAVDQLVPLLDEHMTVEETRALPLIAKYITATEWGAMVSDAASGIERDRLPTMLGIVLYEAEPLAIEQTLSHMPEDQRVVLRDAATKAYAEYAERIYGTATPPRYKR